MKLYETLGIAVNSAKSEIKKAYRKLAKQYHPDKGGDEEMFKEIQTAYDVLKDDKKREHYDRTGDTNNSNGGPEKLLMAIFGAVIESGDFHGNIIDRIIEKLNEQIDSMKKSKREIKIKMDDLIKAKGRISTDGENLFELVLQGTIDQLNGLLTSKESDIIEMVKMKEIISLYLDERPDAGKREPSIQELMSGLGGFGQQRGGRGQGPFGL